MPRDRFKLAEIAQKHWTRAGEQIVWAVERKGHVGSAGTAPHRIAGAVPDAEIAEPEWPLPTAAVSSGRFGTDEWAHDPAVWGWAHARGPEQISVRWADLFTAGRDECWLLLSNQRLGLVVEGEVLTPERGGLFSRSRETQAEPLITWWEAPVSAARRFVAVPLGRLVEPEWFVRVEFADGSAFDFRDPQAEQSVRTAYANL
ncbi:hypothetical protein [Lentzea sp. NBRC 102530]|uniref:hypothetical protein n=1 Tax=Lentzea sp. NBRC 102530 TaxID=3032201 RepID=UPI0024A58465|nr:hypothetical protein [Lentzea sp. NBRC 102530]GLY50620.1 hypothetical protein Lesp01_42760 [Lentzea sp. NBRC 102530]